MALVYSSPTLWSAQLSQFFHVYSALEDALAKGSASDARLAALHRQFFLRLARTEAFLCDVRVPHHAAPLRV